jgi:predicted ArsR family transcriptional regulator
MSMDARASILRIAYSDLRGVKEVVQKIDLRTSNALLLLEKMSEEGLINLESKRSERGRPKKIVKPTALGYEFLQAYEKLKVKSLKSRKSDLKHAVDDALYTRRLVEKGHSPFALFMELNNIASNIKVSAKTP